MSSIFGSSLNNSPAADAGNKATFTIAQFNTLWYSVRIILQLIPYLEIIRPDFAGISKALQSLDRIGLSSDKRRKAAALLHTTPDFKSSLVSFVNDLTDDAQSAMIKAELGQATIMVSCAFDLLKLTIHKEVAVIVFNLASLLPADKGEETSPAAVIGPKVSVASLASRLISLIARNIEVGWEKTYHRAPKLFITGVLMAAVLLLVSGIVLIPWLLTPTQMTHTTTDGNKVIVVIPTRNPISMSVVPAWEPKDLKLATDLKTATPDQKTIRWFQLLKAMDFLTLSHQGIADGVFNVVQLNAAVEQSVIPFLQANPKIAADFEKQFGLPKENFSDLILAIIWKESQGNWNAKSDTGPVGPGMFTEETGRAMGLVGDDVLDTNGDATGEFTFDYRTDPLKVIPAMLQLLKEENERHHSLELAVFAYHSGDRRVNKVMAAMKQDGLKWESYKEFFLVDPLGHPNTFAATQDLMNKKDNFGPTYYPGVVRVMQLLWLYWQSPKEFDKLAAAQQKRDTPSKVQLCQNIAKATMAGKTDEAVKLRKSLDSFKPTDKVEGDPKARFWAAYSCSDLLQFITFDDFKAAADKKVLVDIPSGDLGISLRAGKDGGLGQMDPTHETYYRKFSPNGWGMLAIAAYQFTTLHPETSLDITSMARPWEYTEKVNKTGLPTHTFMVSADIALKGLTPVQVRDLKYTFNEMQYGGDIVSYIVEGTPPIYDKAGKVTRESVNWHIHVVLLPNEQAQKVAATAYKAIAN